MPIPTVSPEQSRPAIVVDDVSKAYLRFSAAALFGSVPAGASYALHRVSFALGRGEMLGILGPNGAGKTTLLKIITTMTLPTSGQVLVNGMDVGRHPGEARKMMGLVTCDERSFYWRLSARQNMAFFGNLYGLTKREVECRTASLLDAVGLAEAADRPYQEFSSGMKQKLAIARGLLSNPDIVFYDEPTRSLDPLSAQSIRNWIAGKRKADPRQTHVIATNQLSEAEQLCDRILILSRGRILAHGTVAEVRSLYRPKDYEVHRIIYSGEECGIFPETDLAASILETRREESGSSTFVLRFRAERQSSTLSRILETLLRSGATVLHCESEQVSLDEVFCSLVSEDSAATLSGAGGSL